MNDRWRGAAGPLLVAGLLAVVVVVWQVVPVLRSHGSRAMGDGEHPETYGFDLRTCLVDRAVLTGGRMPRDGVPVLDTPRLVTAAGVDSLNAVMRGKYLVSSDRVIGVVSNGAARAYPVRVLCWHEVVNDTLGGVPIAVAYNPLCDSAAAFAAVGEGDTLRFGISGLLWNSCHLLYDRRAERAGESLWSPLQGRAVAGPAAAAGRALRGLPLAVLRWDDWRRLQPATTVLLPERALRERYRRNPYGVYYGDERLRFPVAPRPAADDPRLKEPVVAVEAGGETRVYVLRDLARRAGLADGELVWPDSPGGVAAALGRRLAAAPAVWTTVQGGATLRFEVRPEPLTVLVADADRPGRPLPARQAFWFAWHAQRPGDLPNGR
jgi:hypothetical protein